ncbi:MAG: alpha-ketoacid dehydrogenase subunit beta [Rhodospirillaceae bacterium]|jgi:pyruvate dehydrogenase E1 component beta subunit|nr:alpha-ketoacid dehydrogenase subunit beta [Rhodospirillaceae bacterium]
MAEITFVEAITQALRRAMTDDERVVLLGQDIGTNGGVFRSTQGLLQEFGPERVLDTPLAESMIAGVAVGLAAEDFRPVAEIQFMGFVYPAVDQIVNHASRMRNRTRGRITSPLVVRTPMGAGIGAPEHHSESTEAMFTNIPGLRVVIPSSPQRAYGLLLAAIADPDPVIFLEPTRLYRAYKEDVPDNGEALPLDECFVLRDGDDVTLVTWGAMVRETLAVADGLAEDGISAEVIDVGTLQPLDADTIVSSVDRTGRLVVVHEAPLTGGFGAEIAARVSEQALMSLKAPIARVAAPDVIVPLPRLESHYLPNAATIEEAVQRTVSYA